MKKPSNLERLLGYAGSYRILTCLSWVFAAVSALLALVPFWYIWRILREVLEAAPDYSAAVHIAGYGWMAVLFAASAIIVYIGALMCSHLAAFRVATNLRLTLTKLAVEGLDGFEVSDLELQREGPSYTVDTLRQLSAQHPGDTLWLMMGTDILSDQPGMVIFSNYSFICQDGWYNSVTDEYRRWDGAEPDMSVAAAKLAEVQNRVAYSAVILDYDYYRLLFWDVRPAKAKTG